MRKTMTHEELELNGCYAMLCEALRAWYRLQHDHTRELAAKTLKDVYGYEFHLNGGGCPWRLPSVDHEWALNGMRALACRKTSSQRTRLSLLACLTAKRRTMNSRRDIPWKHRKPYTVPTLTGLS